MNGWEIVVSFVFGLLVNEVTDVSPWAARKLVRWAAYRWTTDPDIAAGYAEEWTAIVEERPGKLLKLMTAVQFSLGAAGRAAPRAFAAARHAAGRRLAVLRADPDTRLIFMPTFLASASGTVGAGAWLYGGENLWVPIIFMLVGSVMLTSVVFARLVQRRRSGPNRLS